MPNRLNPFAKLPNGRAVWAWGMYDLANQSFQLLINTLLFSLFVQQVVVGDPAKGRTTWSIMVASSMLLVVILSPLLGALADHKAWKREMLLVTGVVCSILTACLALIQPGQIGLAFALYLVAALACGLGENFLGSFLPEISTPKNVGYVSALGWTMSYAGALLLLGITALYAFVFHRADAAQARPMFVFSGLWFAAGILPAFLFLRERATPQPGAAHTVMGQAFKRLATSAREAARYRHLARFFLAFFVYSLGVSTVIYFLGLISDDLGNTLGQTILFALEIALTAGLASALVARFQDRLGHKRTVMVFLLTWVVATAGLAGVRALMPDVGDPGPVLRAAFWVVAALIGVGLGGIGTASRAVVGAFSPADKAGEFFGVWGAVYKFATILGVLAFGKIRNAIGLPVSLLVLAAFFAAGLLLLLRVNEAEGIAAAGHPPEGAPPAPADPAGPSNPRPA
ncbi:MAG: MFS transporter [Phycisphaerales bacterium]|nr:MFS transporter [Phycisphaerales bacterium]